jgi:hypothetical protein
MAAFPEANHLIEWRYVARIGSVCLYREFSIFHQVICGMRTVDRRSGQISGLAGNFSRLPGNGLRARAGLTPIEGDPEFVLSAFIRVDGRLSCLFPQPARNAPAGVSSSRHAASLPRI